MGTAATSFATPLRSFGRQTFFLVAALGLAAVVCLRAELIPFLLAACLLVTLVALSRLKVANLCVALILADHLCQLLKRAIFELGPQAMMTYYAFQLLPTLFLFMAALTSLFFLVKRRMPPSTAALVLYLLIAGLTTVVSPSGATVSGRLAGVNQQLAPVLAIFIGMATSLLAYRKIAKLLLALIIASVLYGMYQFALGPTPMDRAWAVGTHEFSIEGSKVYAYVSGMNPEFRVFSYYADHTSWGFFLVMALLFLFAARQVGSVNRGWLYLAVPLTIAGVIASETRTVFVALLGAVGVHWILSLKTLRRPVLILTGVVISFGLVVSAGTYALQHYNFAIGANALVNRYMTVGTMEARISAWTLMLSVLKSHWLLGTGLGFGSGFRSLDPNYQFTAEMYSHNVVVDMILQTGLLGVLVLIAFIYLWLNEAFWVVRNSDPGTGRAVRWMVAAIVGMLLTGSLNGATFLTTYFFLFLGFVGGQWTRLRAAYSGLPPLPE